MKISVIIPTFNSGDELEKALKSVIEQAEFRDGRLELIVVDDGSDSEHQDKLTALAEVFPKELRLLRLSENRGPAAARNEGLKHATGEWIGFIDADDIWSERRISAFWPWMESGEFEIISGKIRYFSRNGSALPILPYEDDAHRLHHVHLGALLAKKQVFSQGLYFNESLRLGEDTDWWIRVREEKKKICLIQEETLLYHIHGKNMTKGTQGTEMLHLLHLSLKRRRQQAGVVEAIPSLKSFAVPGIEVVIPVYNGEKFIKQAIESVLTQTHPVKKIWVVNDGSTDGTGPILDKLQFDNPIIQVLHSQNQGVSAAINSVLPMIGVEWISFLDADDLWMPDRIQTQVEYLQNNPDISCIFGQIEEFEDLSDDFRGRFKAREGAMEGIHRSTLLCKLVLFKEFGGFDPSLKVGEFIDWFQNVRGAGKKFHVIPKVLAKRRIHGENMTAKVDRNEFLQLIRRQLAQKRNG
jgi:glycosyltransferase involved in cell wall biosynthesis